MKFTLAWLKQHLETDAPLGALTDRLTMIGFELQGIEDRAAALGSFTVGYVIEAARHPNADRLSVCRVDTGAGEAQVVCGAPNARTGMKGVFAAPGSHIPGTGIELRASKIRGVESRGMLLSEHEMGLSDDHDSIVELPPDAPVGAPCAQVMGLDDPVIDVAVMPNRPDCLGVYGLARDLAAAGLGTLNPLPADPVPGSFESPVTWLRDFPEGQGAACPMVVGRYFRGVRNGPSPGWVQRRLAAVGLRPISALVDITNLVILDLGRPLHVFDADKLAGDLTMRFARAGESILALNEKRYALDGEMVVIADAHAVHGIGGVMGGEASGCTADTTDVFLEVALFDPVRVAATGRRLGIESDARYRFERGLDPHSALWGAEVAARLIQSFCGGEASRVSVAGALPATGRPLALRGARVSELGGVDVPLAEQSRILDALGFAPRQADGAIETTVPSWRPDIDGEADLVEEVVRIWGYDRVPVIPLRLPGSLPAPAYDLDQQRVRLVRRALANRGMVEAVTWSFTDSGLARLFGGDEPTLVLENPISSELDTMRPSVLPNLIVAAKRNADRGYPDLALFEVGPQFANDTPAGEATVAAGVIAGRRTDRHWATAAGEADAFDAKAAALAGLAALGAPMEKLRCTADAPAWYHPGRAGTLRLGPHALAHFGEAHPRVLRLMDLGGAVAVFEIFLAAVPEPKARRTKGRPLLAPSPFQPVRRDFAFVVDAGVAAETLVRAARGAERALITDVQVFDVYTGKGVAAGRKSLAIAVTLQPRERTLTEAEIDRVGEKIVAAVGKATGGTLRG